MQERTKALEEMSALAKKGDKGERFNELERFANKPMVSDFTDEIMEIKALAPKLRNLLPSDDEI